MAENVCLLKSSDTAIGAATSKTKPSKPNMQTKIEPFIKSNRLIESTAGHVSAVFCMLCVLALAGCATTPLPIGDKYAPGLRPVVLSVAHESKALRTRTFFKHTIKLQRADDPLKFAYGDFNIGTGFLSGSVKELRFTDDYEEGEVNIVYLAPGRYKVSGWAVNEPYSTGLQSGTRFIYSVKPLAIDFEVPESGTTYLGRFTCRNAPYSAIPAQQVPCLFVVSDQKIAADMALAAPFLVKNALQKEPLSRPLLPIKQLPFPFVKKAIDTP
jgi:hypothetical protein